VNKLTYLTDIEKCIQLLQTIDSNSSIHQVNMVANAVRDMLSLIGNPVLPVHYLRLTINRENYFTEFDDGNGHTIRRLASIYPQTHLIIESSDSNFDTKIAGYFITEESEVRER